MQKRKVVITGIGILSPLGATRETSWKAAINGESGIARITKFDPSFHNCQIAGELKNYAPEKYIEPKEMKKLDPFSQYAILAGHEAWEDAGLNSTTTGSNTFNPHRMASILGVGIGGLTTLEKYHQAWMEGGPRKISPFLIPAMISNLAPGHLAMRFGLKGPNFTITSACASSTHAIGESARMIASGYLDMIMSGGAESAITPVGMGGFCAMKALSQRNDDPTKASRPFDKDRDGFVMGEGSAVLVLESYESAVKRGAKIYCELAGYGASDDAYHITSPSEDGEGAITCMSEALTDAGMNPTDIQYINAHGTSTAANDATETLAIKKVFGSWANEGLMVSSTKSMTGHLLGAAGAVEAAFTAMAIKEGIIPPTVNLDNPDAGFDLDYVPHKARQAKITGAISNSFGFGGTNGCIVFKAAQKSARTMAEDFLSEKIRAEDIILGSLGYGEEAKLTKLEATASGFSGKGRYQDGEEFDFCSDLELSELEKWAIKVLSNK